MRRGIVMKALVTLFVPFLLVLHGGLGWVLHNQRPKLGVLPPLPTESAIQAMSFGDQQFLYRSLVMQIQNAGDTGGRFTPMSQYNITEVVQWLTVLQKLDRNSSHYTALAARYFSLDENPQRIKSLISFIDGDVDRAPDRKWYWQTQAVAMANSKLKDANYALELSRKLNTFKDFLPSGYAWVLQMEPVLLADLGRSQEAREVMGQVVRDYGVRMTETEMNWTNGFLLQLK